MDATTIVLTVTGIIFIKRADKTSALFLRRCQKWTQ